MTPQNGYRLIILIISILRALLRIALWVNVKGQYHIKCKQTLLFCCCTCESSGLIYLYNLMNTDYFVFWNLSSDFIRNISYLRLKQANKCKNYLIVTSEIYHIFLCNTFIKFLQAFYLISGLLGNIIANGYLILDKQIISNQSIYFMRLRLVYTNYIIIEVLFNKNYLSSLSM